MKRYTKPATQYIKIAGSSILAASGQIEEGYAKPSTTPANFWMDDNDSTQDDDQDDFGGSLWK